MLKIGLIGCGKIGGALLRGIESALGSKNVSVALCDAVPAAVKALQEGLKCRTKAETALKVAEGSDVVILAVKPGDMKNCVSLGKAKNRPLYLSIAAGIAIAKLESWLGEGQRHSHHAKHACACGNRCGWIFAWSSCFRRRCRVDLEAPWSRRHRR